MEWWSKTVNIRTESCDVGSFFTCHNHNGFVTERYRDNEFIVIKYDTLDESIHKTFSVAFNGKIKATETFENAENLLLAESRHLILLNED